VPLALVFLLALGIGVGCGMVNGLIVTVARVPSLVVTLGTLYIIRGIDGAWAGGNQVNASMLPNSFNKIGYGTVAGVPYLGIIAIVAVAIATYAMRSFRTARDFYAIGSDPDAARLAGIPVGPRVFLAFVLSGAIAGLTGAFWLSLYGSVDAIAGAGYAFQAIAARAVVAFARWEVLLLALLGATIFYGAQVSPYFLHSTNLFFICLNVGEVAIMALPLTLLVVTGEIDLSVASTVGLSGVLMAELFKHGWPIWPAMIAAVVLGSFLGAVNGFLVTRVGLPSLAVTIGTLTLYRGIAQGILPTDTIGGFPTNLASIGVIPIPHTHVPYSIAFFAALAIVFAV